MRAGAGAASASAASTARPAQARRRWRMSPLNTTHPTRLWCGRRPAPARAALDLLDVDGLGALVPVLLLVADLRALREGAVAVAADPGEVDEQVTPTLVGRDEAEALVVREPLDRAGAH